MKFDDFIKKWNGIFCEIAGSADTQTKNQCVDLANAYIRDVLNLPIIEWTNAVDFPSKAGDKYEYILNTPINVPQKGDIVVWKPSPGHIAIFIEGNTNNFKSFDQNFPVGSVCHVQDHTYQNVIGWLKAKPQEPMMTISIKDFEKIRGNSEKLDKIHADLGMTGDPATTPFEKFKEAIGNIRDRETDNWNNFQEQKRQRETLEIELDSLRIYFDKHKAPHPDTPNLTPGSSSSPVFPTPSKSIWKLIIKFLNKKIF